MLPQDFVKAVFDGLKILAANELERETVSASTKLTMTQAIKWPMLQHSLRNKYYSPPQCFANISDNYRNTSVTNCNRAVINKFQERL